MGFAEDMGPVDADVFAMLGDDVLYRAAGTLAWVPLMGFTEDREPALDYGEMDSPPPKRRLKVRRADVPNPTSGDRWKIPLWGNLMWAMSNREPVTANRDWLIEMQKASG